MKTTYLREIRHIVANHLLSNKSTGYCSNSKSETFGAIRDLLNLRLIETKNDDGQFIFVSPTEKLLAIYGSARMDAKTSAVPVTKTAVIWSKKAQNAGYKYPVVIPA